MRLVRVSDHLRSSNLAHRQGSTLWRADVLGKRDGIEVLRPRTVFNSASTFRSWMLLPTCVPALRGESLKVNSQSLGFVCATLAPLASAFGIGVRVEIGRM